MLNADLVLSHLRQRLETLNTQRKQVPASFQRFKERTDKAREELLRGAGIFDKFQQLQAQQDAEQARLQKLADLLGARIAEIEDQIKHFEQMVGDRSTAVVLVEEEAPIEAGPDPAAPEVHRVHVGELEEKTRLLFLRGNKLTREVLREDGTMIVDDDGRPIDPWWERKPPIHG